MRKLLITTEFQKQIDYLHKRVGNTEWGGVLFYKLSSSITDPDCTFIPQFIFPMNVGTSGATEYDYSHELLDAYDMFPDAEQCKEGIIHTHHSMGASFSAVDMDDLKENAKNYDFYLSLVVDFKRTYVAKIAFRPDQSSLVIKREGSEFSLTDFEFPLLTIDLKIVYEDEDEENPPIFADRVNELLKRKKEEDEKKKSSTTPKYGTSYDYSKSYGYGGAKELPFPQTNTQKDTGKVNNYGKHSMFLVRWLKNDENADDSLYWTIWDVQKEVNAYDRQDQTLLLSNFTTDLIDTFEEMFTQVNGKDISEYVKDNKAFKSELELLNSYSDIINATCSIATMKPVGTAIIEAIDFIRMMFVEEKKKQKSKTKTIWKEQ